ncbi:hypothetical protein J2Z84_000155 [Agrobacterium rubi]|nr:hypothetical protein [Agrobacterium rubi]
MTPIFRDRAGQFGYAGYIGGVLFHLLILTISLSRVNSFPTFS